MTQYNVRCKPNNSFLYNTHSEMNWLKMIYSNKSSTKKIHQQNNLLKVSQTTQKQKVYQAF